MLVIPRDLLIEKFDDKKIYSYKVVHPATTISSRYQVIFFICNHIVFTFHNLKNLWVSEILTRLQNFDNFQYCHFRMIIVLY